MDSDGKPRKWPLARVISKPLGLGMTAAGMLIAQSGETSRGATPQNPAPQVATNGQPRRDVQHLINEIRSLLGYSDLHPREEIEKLIIALGSPRYAERQKSMVALTKLGCHCRPYLKMAVASPALTELRGRGEKLCGPATPGRLRLTSWWVFACSRWRETRSRPDARAAVGQTPARQWPARGADDAAGRCERVPPEPVWGLARQRGLKTC